MKQQAENDSGNVTNTSISTTSNPVSLPRNQNPKIDNTFGSGGNRQNKFKDALQYMIVKDNRSFSVAEGDGFQLFVKRLIPDVKIPS